MHGGRLRITEWCQTHPLRRHTEQGKGHLLQLVKRDISE